MNKRTYQELHKVGKWVKQMDLECIKTRVYVLQILINYRLC